jgi:hypothetical protein
MSVRLIKERISGKDAGFYSFFTTPPPFCVLIIKDYLRQSWGFSTTGQLPTRFHFRILEGDSS